MNEWRRRKKKNKGRESGRKIRMEKWPTKRINITTRLNLTSHPQNIYGLCINIYYYRYWKQNKYHVWWILIGFKIQEQQQKKIRWIQQLKSVKEHHWSVHFHSKFQTFWDWCWFLCITDGIKLRHLSVINV